MKALVRVREEHWIIADIDDMLAEVASADNEEDSTEDAKIILKKHIIEERLKIPNIEKCYVQSIRVPGHPFDLAY